VRHALITVADHRRHTLIASAALVVATRPDAPLGVLMLAWAVTYAANGWRVFPLRGKVPAIAGGHGVLDATEDIATVVAWWTGKYRGANIGARVPDGLMVIDTDPRKPGHAEAAAVLRELFGEFTDTLTTVSGRQDGGKHRYYRRPEGKLSAKLLGPGFDLKTSSGYMVMPPSLHPDTGLPYTPIDAPIADPDDWVADLIVVEESAAEHITAGRSASAAFLAGGGGTYDGDDSIADWYTESHSWADILMPHGWACRGNGDPDADGTVWLHPTHTSNCSATVRHGCLFVYSTNTPFEVTESSNPKGYTRFRAFAVLEHGGDMSAAARSLRKVT
jgi:hypothetical protein